MFTNITRRTTTYVMLSVFILLVIVLIAIFSLSESLLTNDYIAKIIRFSKQEAINCSTKLEMLTSNINNIVHDLDVNDNLFATKTNADITMQLKKKTTYSPYIQNFYIYKDSKMVYYLNTIAGAPNLKQLLENTSSGQRTDGFWIPVASTPQNRLFYVKVLHNGYAVAFHVDENEILSVFKNTSPFFEKENTFFYADNKLCIFSDANASPKITDNAFAGKYNELTFEKGKIILSLPIEKTTLKVCSVAKSDYITSTSVYLVRIFIIILIITMVLCYIMINRFAKEITDSLEEIHTRLQGYHH